MIRSQRIERHRAMYSFAYNHNRNLRCKCYRELFVLTVLYAGYISQQHHSGSYNKRISWDLFTELVPSCRTSTRRIRLRRALSASVPGSHRPAAVGRPRSAWTGYWCSAERREARAVRRRQTCTRRPTWTDAGRTWTFGSPSRSRRFAPLISRRTSARRRCRSCNICGGMTAPCRPAAPPPPPCRRPSTARCCYPRCNDHMRH